jgi:beta-lactamase superfamily II metal-dependent hydrolase
VDTGPTSTGEAFRKRYRKIVASGECMDAVFITHYDDDHIGGILKLIELEPCIKIGRLFFNAFSGGTVSSANLSAMQNQRLFHTNLPATVITDSVLAGQKYFLDGAVITVIAPTIENRSKALEKMKEANIGLTQLAATSDWGKSFDELMDLPYPQSDNTIANLSSIVFVFEYCGKRLLFCADAPASSIISGLTLVQDRDFDLVKLPHHGSARNINDMLLKMFSADKFLICADGTTHPGKLTVSKLLKEFPKVNIYSNYSWWMYGFLKDQDKHYLNEGILTFQNIS